MAKILFWLAVIFGALFVLRMVNVAKARSRARHRPDPKQVAVMVQCRGCGVYLPAAEARQTADGYRCGAPGCRGSSAR